MHFCRRWWAAHSLTIVLAAIGLSSYAAGTTVMTTTSLKGPADFLLNLGHGFFPLAVYNLLAGKFYERNKPDEPPRSDDAVPPQELER